jgi:uncharacterized protein (TIGR02284 family)
MDYMTEKQASVNILNTLVLVNNDRVDGYYHASLETDEKDLKDLFSVLSANSQRCNEELSEFITALDGEPATGISTSGKIHGIWMDIKSSITKNDRRAILDSCEFVEEMAVKAYEKVAKEHFADLSFELNQVIKEQYQWVKKDHKKVENLRDAVPA